MDVVKITCEGKKSSYIKKHNKKLSIISSAFAGLISGMFGGGGGMIIVPILVFFLKKNQKIAHATANFIMLPITALCGLFYGVFGNFSSEITLPTMIGVLVGGIIGAKLLKKLSNKWIKIFFACLTAFFGVRLLLS